MKEINIQALQATSYLSGSNAGYIEDLYEQYLKDPQAVDPKWRQYFAALSQNGSDVSHADIRAHFEQLVSGSAINRVITQFSGDIQHEHQQVQVNKLIDAFRRYGHYQAQLDPLNFAAKQPRPELELSYYGFNSADLKTKFNIINGTSSQPFSLQEIYQNYKKNYCDTIGFEYQHITNLEQVKWLQEKIEAKRPVLSADTKKRILKELTQAEGLEKFLGAKYVGQTRFSLEGGDSLMPMMDEIIQRAGTQQVKEIVIGMGHRGRLNILVNTCGMTIQDLCLAFEGKLEEPGSGDVKYHLGASSDIQTETGPIHLSLLSNPSHLEIVDPVVEGSVRARQHRRRDHAGAQVLPVLIHGDAAFAGQGVVMETFAFSQTRGYGTGGTLHIVVNNQIGFTINNPQDARSSWYSTDIAKMIEAPIFHVNADDPEAVLFVSQLALDFRMKFKKDVVIDLVCYRRYGHNEGDEPSATQPKMYQIIKQQPSVRKLYADKLVAESILTQEQVDALIAEYRDKLDQQKPIINFVKNDDKYLVNWQPYLKSATSVEIETSVALPKLKTLAQTIESLPEGFTLQAQVAKMMDDRRKMTAGELPLNWGYAETLAYATLLDEGHSIRMSGEDCQRGTFAHRHAVLHDQNTGITYTPLVKAAKDPATFTTIDSILSEEAVLAFEYGYATSSPESLVIWEAQYGDFVNVAQSVIDQFINCGEQKWGHFSGLTMYLPHGYEGAGPEHSSGRIERFLQLCAENNMQVCVPTMPAQVFHMIRRQVLRPVRKPLIVFTPKSVLRHKLAVSSLQDLAQGRFQLIISEIDDIKAADVQRVILCSGKVYYDLLEQRRARNIQNIAIIRVEQLYPYPKAEITKELEKYKKAKEIIWCQEEPKNQGAWYTTVHTLTDCLTKGQTLRYAGRPAAAATAVGSKYVHAKQQKALIDEAFA